MTGAVIAFIILIMLIVLVEGLDLDFFIFDFAIVVAFIVFIVLFCKSCGC